MSREAEVSVRASPGAETWAGLALSRFEATTEKQRAARAELGLPIDRPVIMTGHQAGFWHPGILAKYIAADRVAASIGGVAAAVVVDHDVVDPLRLSAARIDRDGRIENTVVHLRARSDKPLLSRLEPPIGERELQRVVLPTGLLEPDRAAVERITASLLTHTVAGSLAEQVALANADLLQEWMSVRSFTVQRLVRTDGWKGFFQAVLEDPSACAQAYNRAVAKYAEAGIPPLYAMAREHRWELPFWLLDRDRGRRPLYAEMVEQPMFDADHLAPKALSLTASLRRGLCDLFIHGTGGSIYDRATDDWMREWLGEELAPSVAISADAYRSLPVEARRGATDASRDHALWLAHSARHNPDLLGDHSAAEEKRVIIDGIRRAERGSGVRHDLYRTMHDRLARVRDEHRERLSDLDEEARAIEQGIAVRELESRRDWPTAMYPAGTLERLASVVEDTLSTAAS